MCKIEIYYKGKNTDDTLTLYETANTWPPQTSYKVPVMGIWETVE